VNKTELIDRIAESADISKASAARAPRCWHSMPSRLRCVSRIPSCWSVSERSPSRSVPRATGRNPQTGATIEIKAARVPGFKAGKALKDALN